jgi:hypothetical protein
VFLPFGWHDETVSSRRPRMRSGAVLRRDVPADLIEYIGCISNYNDKSGERVFKVVNKIKRESCV